MNDQLKPLLNQPKFKSQQFIIKVVMNICISSTMFGYTNSYFSAIDYQDFTQIFQITQYKPFYQGFLTGQVYLTAALGGFAASFLLKKFSRTHSFLVANAVYLVALIGVMFKNINSLIFFRLIQGCISGIYSSLVPLYIKEFSPLELNSKVGPFYQMFAVFGLGLSFFVTYICSLFSQPQFYWRLVFGFPIILISFQSYMLIYKYNYETPKYLLSIENNQEANKLLNVIYKEEYVEERIIELKKMFSLSSNKNIELKQITKKQLKNQIKTLNQIKKDKKQIEYHNNKLAIYAAIHITTLQQFSGISIVIGYGAEIVKSVFPSLSKILPIFLHFQAIIACLIAILLLKKQGRKTLAQYGCIFCGFFTFYLGYKFSELRNQSVKISTGVLILSSLFTYRFIYGVTLGPIAFLYVAEIIEPNIMPIVLVIYWFAAFLTVMLFPLLKSYVFDGNPGPIFVFFAAYTLLSLIINYYVMVETKDKKQYQIRMEYDRLLGIQHEQNPQKYEQKIDTKRISLQN